VHGFWSVEDLADGRTNCDEVVKDGCLLAVNFSLKTSTVLTEGKKNLTKRDTSLH
jgi:hypothetical protein